MTDENRFSPSYIIIALFKDGSHVINTKDDFQWAIYLKTIKNVPQNKVKLKHTCTAQ